MIGIKFNLGTKYNTYVKYVIDIQIHDRISKLRIFFLNRKGKKILDFNMRFKYMTHHYRFRYVSS